MEREGGKMGPLFVLISNAILVRIGVRCGGAEYRHNIRTTLQKWTPYRHTQITSHSNNEWRTLAAPDVVAALAASRRRSSSLGLNMGCSCQE